MHGENHFLLNCFLSEQTHFGANYFLLEHISFGANYFFLFKSRSLSELESKFFH